MHKLKFLVAVCSMLMIAMFAFVLNANAQEAQSADVMRSSGKIYVVVAVILIILIGLFIYLANLDRKISRLDKSDKL